MKKKRLLAAIALALGANAAFASPAEDVITPDIEKGEREFEFAYGTDRNDEGKYESALELSFGAGIPTAGPPSSVSSSSVSAAST